MIEVHRRHGTGHVCDNEWDAFLSREDRARLGIRRQAFGADDASLRLVVGAEGLVRGEVDALFLSLHHAGQCFLEVRQQLMMSGHKLAHILRDDELRFRNRDREFHQHYCAVPYGGTALRQTISSKGGTSSPMNAIITIIIFRRGMMTLLSIIESSFSGERCERFRLVQWLIVLAPEHSAPFAVPHDSVASFHTVPAPGRLSLREKL